MPLIKSLAALELIALPGGIASVLVVWNVCVGGGVGVMGVGVGVMGVGVGVGVRWGLDSGKSARGTPVFAGDALSNV